ncbi:MAG: SMC-Scp complex subunit ScpB [Deltaproteobacteria bacterium]|nr:SMC-Scp complex subunit ScpB [Deltaproteobacteria bacterium]
MERAELKAVAEALIFAEDHPISIERMAGVLEGEDKAEIRAVVKELTEDYGVEGRGFYLEEVAGGYQFKTRPEHAQWIKRLFKIGMQRMSKAGLETLSIVAYKQPLTRADLESIRGVDSAGVLKTLLERRLIKIVGRQDAPGRPVVYGTTREFLETFNLKDLAGLPTLKDIEALEEDITIGGEDGKEEEQLGQGQAQDDQSGSEEVGSEDQDTDDNQAEDEAKAQAEGDDNLDDESSTEDIEEAADQDSQGEVAPEGDN